MSIIKKWLSIFVTTLVLSTLVSVLPWDTQRVEAAGNATIIFNSSGTSVDKDGQLTIRLDFYFGEGSETYPRQYVYQPIIPPEGYQGKTGEGGAPIDLVDYQKWLDNLPHIWQLNPAICVFISIDQNTTKDSIVSFIGQRYMADVLATLDHSLVQSDSIHLVSSYMRDKTTVSHSKVDAAVAPPTDKNDLAQLQRYQNFVNEVNNRLADIRIDLLGNGNIVPVELGSIVIGTTPVNRASSSDYDSTWVDKNQTATGTGTIDTWQLWAESAMAGCDVATFFVVSGNNLSTRDYEALGAVAAGSTQTYSGKSTDVILGDYPGVKPQTSGAIERDNSGVGYWYAAGDQIPCTNQAFTLVATRIISLYGTGSSVVIPTVTTQAVSSVEEATATGSGNITNIGGENCTARGIQYGTNTGNYTDNFTDTGNYGTGNFTTNMSGLTKGEEYFARAFAKNTAGYGYGAEVTFITKPDPANIFTVTDNGSDWLSFSWTNGTGMDYVEVRYLQGGAAPSNNTSGTQGYYGSGITTNVTGLLSNTTYSVRIFTYATEGGLWSISDSNPTTQGATDPPIPANYGYYSIGLAGASSTYLAIGLSGDNNTYLTIAFSTANISVTPESKDMGGVLSNTTYYAFGSAPSNPVSDNECYFTANNTGDVIVNLLVNGTNFVDGSIVTLTSGIPGTNQIRLTLYCSGQNPASGVVLSNSNQILYTGLGAGDIIKFDFKEETGTFGDLDVKTGFINFTGVIP